jgi:hypothetical protein
MSSKMMTCVGGLLVSTSLLIGCGGASTAGDGETQAAVSDNRNYPYIPCYNEDFSTLGFGAWPDSTDPTAIDLTWTPNPNSPPGGKLLFFREVMPADGNLSLKGGGWGQPIANVSQSDGVYVDRGLQPGTGYAYKARFTNQRDCLAMFETMAVTWTP